MSNILAALLGGAGAGAQSYGGSMQREQEQQRMQAQRMAEMQQQEAARRRLQSEDDSRAAAARQLETTEATALARTLGIEIPDGVNVNRASLPLLQNNQSAKATAARDAQRLVEARADRGRANEARYGTLAASGRLPKGMAYNENEDYTTWNGILSQEDAQRSAQQGRQFVVDNRPPRPEPKDMMAETIAKRAMELMQPQRDEYGGYTLGLDGPAARARAEQEVNAAYNIGPRSSASAPPAPAGANMMRGLGVSGGASSLRPLSEDEKNRANADPGFRAYLIQRGYRL